MLCGGPPSGVGGSAAHLLMYRKMVIMTTARIVAGPSLWEVILSLFEEKSVKFTLEGGTKVSFSISAVMDHKHWDNLDDQELPPPCFLLTGEYTEAGADHVVHACYSTTNRAGLMSIVIDQNNSYGLLHQEWARRIIAP